VPKGQRRDSAVFFAESGEQCDGVKKGKSGFLAEDWITRRAGAKPEQINWPRAQLA